MPLEFAHMVLQNSLLLCSLNPWTFHGYFQCHIFLNVKISDSFDACYPLGHVKKKITHQIPV